jgi:hypothetical protein
LILTRPIDWDLVRQQYDQMIKYTTALRLGTAETEAILRRFTKKNVQHPTYASPAANSITAEEGERRAKSANTAVFMWTRPQTSKIQNTIEISNKRFWEIFVLRGGQISWRLALNCLSDIGIPDMRFNIRGNPHLLPLCLSN